MSYAHSESLHFATQFHPEHYYHMTEESTHNLEVNEGNINHQREYLLNFAKLATLDKTHFENCGPAPEVVFEHIHNRLQECVAAPTCRNREITSDSNLAIEYWFQSEIQNK